jgi:hypothetical protein
MCRMIMHTELERMWEQVVMAYFNLLWRNEEAKIYVCNIADIWMYVIMCNLLLIFLKHPQKEILSTLKLDCFLVGHKGSVTQMEW